MNLRVFYLVSAMLLLVFVVLLSRGSHYAETTITPDSDSIFKLTQIDRPFFPHEFNEKGQQYYLCKTFGLAYFHKISVTEDRNDYNAVLEESIKKVEGTDKAQFDSILLHLIQDYLNPSVFCDSSVTQILKDEIMAHNSWLDDTVYLNEEIRRKLILICAVGNRRKYPDNNIINQSSIGTINYKEPYPNLSSVFPNKQQRLTGLYHFWNLINYYYVDKYLMDANWDSVLFSFIPVFMAANNPIAYKMAIIELIASLDDSHAVIADPEIYVSVFGKYIPNFRVCKVEDSFVVGNLRSSSLPNSGILPGDIILSINGISLKSLDSSFRKYASGSNDESKQRYMNRLMLFSFKSKNQIDILRRGKIFTVSSVFFDYKLLFKHEIDDFNRSKNKLITRWFKDSIAYLDVMQLSSQSVQKNLDAVENSSSLVLDFRGPYNHDVLNCLSDFILEKNDTTFAMVYPDIRRPGIFRYKKAVYSYLIDANCKKYRRNIAILVDERTQSLAEFAVMALQKNRRVITVGNVSSGADGNVSSFSFPMGIEVLFSSIGILYPDMSPTQRVGIKIDYKVMPTIEAAKTGRDLWIETAISKLSEL